MKRYGLTCALCAGIVLGFTFARSPGSVLSTAEAATTSSPPSAVMDTERYCYFPSTEELATDEIRVIACGTGMPAARRGQGASCFLIETGNGDKFLFDVGTGSMANVAALMIPYEKLDKLFLSHLHTDHMGDIDALWAGGWTAGRPNPLQVWGPSGATPEMGTAYAMENFLQFCNWDYQTRAYKISPIPGQIEVHEFDYRGENIVVYQENGVTVRAWPAIHAGDGPVSYSLEYAGLKVVFGGDTVANTWFPKYAKHADLVIHEAMMLPDQFVQYYNQPPQLGWRTSAEFHTSPQAFGKVMSMVEPRHAIAFHFVNEEAVRYPIYEAIRETYDGPLSMATDMMVWNVTKEGIRERMAVTPDDAWSVPSTAEQPPPEKGRPSPLSAEIEAGRMDVMDAEGNMLRAYWRKHELVEGLPAAYRRYVEDR